MKLVHVRAVVVVKGRVWRLVASGLVGLGAVGFVGVQHTFPAVDLDFDVELKVDGRRCVYLMLRRVHEAWVLVDFGRSLFAAQVCLSAHVIYALRGLLVHFVFVFFDQAVVFGRVFSSIMAAELLFGRVWTSRVQKWLAMVVIVIRNA